jgi:hypothetical protein
MKALVRLSLTLLVVCALIGGCDRPPAPGKPTIIKGAASAKEPDEEASIQANLAKLPAEEQKLAEAQRFCAVEDDRRLGSMGAPYKVLVKDQPVFLCCKGCSKTALADPDKTLAKVRELKEKTSPPRR